MAQTPELAQQLPGSAVPGQIERQFQPPPTPRSTQEPEIRAPLEPAQPPRGAENIRFVLNGVDVEGSTVFKAGDFEPLYKELIGKEVTLRQVYDVATAITAYYGKAGYALSLALVPAQRIRGGRVKIQVIEGYIDEVLIRTEDGKPVDQAKLKAYGAKISSIRPLREVDLERYLLLANDLPGVTARAVLAPSQTMGASSLTLVVGRKFFDGYGSVDNRGSIYVGPYQAQYAANANNLLGLSDRTGIRFINTYPFQQLHYVEINHQEQLDNEGTRLNLLALQSWSHPGGTLEQYDINSTNFSGSVQLYHPFVRSRAQNLSATGKFDFEELRSTTLGQRLSDDSLRILRVGSSYDFIDTIVHSRPGFNLIAIEMSQGLPIPGATGAYSADPSRTGMSASFTKLTFDLSRNQSLSEKFGVVIAGHGQFAFAKVPASEQLGFGGTQFGRGYDPSEIIGDHGIDAKIELQYTEPTCLQRWLSGGCQFYAFSDAGWVWNIQPTASEVAAQSGVSVGAGVRLTINTHLAGYLEFAVPLEVVNSQQQSHDPRVFFGLIAPF